MPGFNPLPSQKQGETLFQQEIAESGVVSIRSPHKSKGRPSTNEPCSSSTGVSIRSPHKSKGRPASFGSHRARPRFQSAPLTKARGDPPHSTDEPRNAAFQSAPLTKARGDVDDLTERAFKALFQSAPLTKARGDRWSTLAVSGLSKVSIRSPHKSKGRLLSGHFFCAPGVVSIRSPHKSKGRLREAGASAVFRKVSIRSPHKSKGRPCSPVISLHASAFQSAPLTKARGDSLPRAAPPSEPSFNPLPSQKQGETQPPIAHGHPCAVSIRSPHKSKGRRRATTECSTHLSFQSAPLTKARGDRTGATGRSHPIGFNPLPSQKQGETEHSPTNSKRDSVSIRSPHKSKGRPPGALRGVPPCLFQSAPLTKARGDLTKLAGRYDFVLFQSAPLTKARGDRQCDYDSGGRVCFNPLPSQKQGETVGGECTSRLGYVSIRSPHKSKGRPPRTT